MKISAWAHEWMHMLFSFILISSYVYILLFISPSVSLPYNSCRPEKTQVLTLSPTSESGAVFLGLLVDGGPNGPRSQWIKVVWLIWDPFTVLLLCHTLATCFEELTHLKRPWCWETLRAGGEGDNRGWDDWMASPTQWIWVCVGSRCWWWIARPGVLQFMGLQRVGYDWATELNWTELMKRCRKPCPKVAECHPNSWGLEPADSFLVLRMGKFLGAVQLPRDAQNQNLSYGSKFNISFCSSHWRSAETEGEVGT